MNIISKLSLLRSRNDTNINVYSNSDSYQKLEDFINKKKSNKVIAFTIEHRASKDQDEISSKFIVIECF